MNKNLLSVAIAATVLLAGCGGGGSSSTSSPVVTPPNTTKAWTYMVYMAADNNLSEAAIDDINEMEKIGSSGQVNVVVQADFSSLYSDLTSSNTQRGLIVKDNRPNQMTSLKSMGRNVNMADPDALVEFVQWAKKNYPAQNYAVVLWSHGDGWKTLRSTGGIQKGALQDETANGYMSFADISKALGQVGDLALINFDACLMGMYEIAYQLRNQAQMLVASPEVEPGTGDPYDLILSDLIAKPQMNASQLAQTITTRYSQSYANSRDTTTKASYDLAQMQQVHNELLKLAQLLSADFEQERINIQQAQQAALAFDQPGHLDLGTFLAALSSRTEQAAVKQQISRVQAVIRSSTTLGLNTTAQADPRYQNANGMGIYLPMADQTDSDDLAVYQALAVSQPSVSWSSVINLLLAGTVQPSTKVDGNFAFKLVWDDANADLDLLISEPSGDVYAPWEGATTPNGFFSGESTESGKTEESYTAASKVSAGDYDVFINYYTHNSCFFDCNNAPAVTAHLLVKEQGSTRFVEEERVVLNFNQPSPISADPLLIMDQIFQNQGESPYSDWAYLGNLTAGQTLAKRTLTRHKRAKGRFNPLIRAQRYQQVMS